MVAMGRSIPCDECEAIAREVASAYAEAWASSDQNTKDAWTAVYKLIGGTEQDAEKAEELTTRARFRDPLTINRALQKKFSHEARTGHRISRMSENQSD